MGLGRGGGRGDKKRGAWKMTIWAYTQFILHSNFKPL